MRTISGFARTARATGLLLVAGLVHCQPVLAGDRANQITASLSWREDRLGETLTYLHAFSGDINAAGVVFRLDASNGVVEDGDDTLSLDAMGGYQIVAGTWKLRALAGLTARETEEGRTFGAKGIVQAQTRKTGEILVDVRASVDTAKMQVEAAGQLGAPISDFFVGPEAGVIASGDWVRSNIGLALTGLRLGEVGLTFRAGYSNYEGTGNGRDGAYLGMAATLQY